MSTTNNSLVAVYLAVYPYYATLLPGSPNAGWKTTFYKVLTVLLFYAYAIWVITWTSICLTNIGGIMSDHKANRSDHIFDVYSGHFQFFLFTGIADLFFTLLTAKHIAEDNILMTTLDTFLFFGLTTFEGIGMWKSNNEDIREWKLLLTCPQVVLQVLTLILCFITWFIDSDHYKKLIEEVDEETESPEAALKRAMDIYQRSQGGKKGGGVALHL